MGKVSGSDKRSFDGGAECLLVTSMPLGSPSPKDSAEKQAWGSGQSPLGLRKLPCTFRDAAFIPLGYPGVISMCKVKSREMGNLSECSLQARGQDRNFGESRRQSGVLGALAPPYRGFTRLY